MQLNKEQTMKNNKTWESFFNGEKNAGFFFWKPWTWRNCVISMNEVLLSKVNKTVKEINKCRHRFRVCCAYKTHGDCSYANRTERTNKSHQKYKYKQNMEKETKEEFEKKKWEGK